MILEDSLDMARSIYFGNRKIVFIKNRIGWFSTKNAFFVGCSSFADATKILNFFENTPHLPALHVLSNEPKKAFKWFKRLFVYISAAGGVVVNNRGELLLIERHGIWDIPKGKIEKNETHRAGALREVSEECGIHNLSIKSKLGSTYHVYTENGKKYLKRTHWFEMAYDGNGTLKPQTCEGITRAEWVKPSNISKTIENTYDSLLQVFEWMGFR